MVCFKYRSISVLRYRYVFEQFFGSCKWHFLVVDFVKLALLQTEVESVQLETRTAVSVICKLCLWKVTLFDNFSYFFRSFWLVSWTGPKLKNIAVEVQRHSAKSVAIRRPPLFFQHIGDNIWVETFYEKPITAFLHHFPPIRRHREKFLDKISTRAVF